MKIEESSSNARSTKEGIGLTLQHWAATNYRKDAKMRRICVESTLIALILFDEQNRDTNVFAFHARRTEGSANDCEFCLFCCDLGVKRKNRMKRSSVETCAPCTWTSTVFVFKQWATQSIAMMKHHCHSWETVLIFAKWHTKVSGACLTMRTKSHQN